MSQNRLKAALLCGGVTFAAWSASAQAAGTEAGTSIPNQASVSYSVGGTQQTASSNIATFVVDKKVNLTVSGGVITQTAINTTDQVTAFQVTNLTNATQDFRLTIDQQSLSVPILGVDNFDVTSMRVFVDSNGNGTYDAGVDTATYIDELAADTSVTVFIVGNIPNAPGSDVAIVSLSAQAASGGQAGTQGTALAATSLLQGDSPSTVDIVFADAAGTHDPARDGIGRAFNAFKIATAAVSMTKTARVLSDPVNLLVNPHAIPGAIIEYCLTVSNAGPGTATNVGISDAVPAGTTYVSNSLSIGGVGSGGQCVLNGTTEDDDTSGADETDLYGGSFDGTTVKGSIPAIVAGISLTAAFRVTIN
ncbi:MAG TPA: DUF11 domain-containing protein [Sphingobium sp.]